MARFAPPFSTTGAGREINRRTVPAAVQAISGVIISTLKQRMRAASTERLGGIATFPADGKHSVRCDGHEVEHPAAAWVRQQRPAAFRREAADLFCLLG